MGDTSLINRADVKVNLRQKLALPVRIRLTYEMKKFLGVYDDKIDRILTTPFEDLKIFDIISKDYGISCVSLFF